MSDSPWNKINFFIAQQYLLARKRQSILATLGVVFGVATFIVLLGFMTGVNDFLDDAVFKGNPDVIISPSPVPISESPQILSQVNPLVDVQAIEKILAVDNNVQAYSRQVISPAILISGVQQLPVRIHGVDPDPEGHMVDLERRLVSGVGINSIEEMTTILLGQSIASQLGVSQGDKLRVVLPNRKTIQLKVSGIFSFGISTIDNFRVYMHSGRLEHLLSKEPFTTHIHVRLKERENLNLKTKLQELSEIRVADWKEGNKTIVVGNRVRHILTWSISLALLLVAGFGIFNILNITVIQKRKDIAILKSIGYKPTDIIAIFSMQSLSIGLLGSVLGLFLGYLISLAIASTPLETNDFIIAQTYPVNFEPIFYLIGLLFGVLTAVFSGYIPAKKASIVDPVQIIRGL